MAADPIYPFGLPGFSPTSSNPQGNPLEASLELMQRALSSFGHSASLASDSMAQTLNPEDLEKRIADLRAVENWLKLNLSMLSSSIQGLEVQLATIKTLRSFVEMGAQTATNDQAQASPLEVVLGLKKSSQSKTANNAPQSSSPDAVPNTPEEAASNPQAAQAWWDMLQSQFTQMAQATTQAASFTKNVATKTPIKPAIKRARRTATQKATKMTNQRATASRNPKKPRD